MPELAALETTTTNPGTDGATLRVRNAALQNSQFQNTGSKRNAKDG